MSASRSCPPACGNIETSLALNYRNITDLPPAETEAAAEPVEDDDAEDGDVVDDEPEQPVHEKPAPEMTVQQLRDAIKAANGFAPRKATKAELAAILETL